MTFEMRLHRWLGVFVAAGLGIAGLAVPAGAASSAARPEACGLLRTAEITRALAQPSAAPTTGAAPLLCDWSLQPTDTRPGGAVSVYLHRGDDAGPAFDLAREFHACDP